MNRFLRNTLTAGAVLAGLLGSSAALAVASISVTPFGTSTYYVGQTGQTLSVDFAVQLEPADTANDVLVQFSHFVAYDPAVLKYKTSTPIQFGAALSSSSGSPARPSVNNLFDVNYTSVGALGFPWDVGTPVQETGYVDGSLLVDMVIDNQTGFVIGDLLSQQQPGPALLFTIVFDVVTTQLGNSAIVLLSDSSFDPAITPPTFDTKMWNGGTPQPFGASTNAINVEVVAAAPVPAPLALLATGLIGLAARRRRVR